MYKSISYWSEPRTEDIAAFEEYYEKVHSHMAARIPGVARFEATRTNDGIGDMPPAFYRVAEMYFDDRAAMETATQTAEWAELNEDAGYIINRFHVAIRSALGTPIEVGLTPSAPRPTEQAQLRGSAIA